MGYGNAAFVAPFILASLGYVATLILGLPVHFALERKGIHSLTAYVLLGTLIGPAFFLIFEALTSYPGQFIPRLQHGYGAIFAAATYSSLAAMTFWAIACRSKKKPLT
jgi:hypothetical protein